MENVEIVQVLKEYADLLDIQGESPFRVRSYRNAAQTIEGLSRPVAELVEHGEDLTKLPGIGSGMAEHIKEILKTGTLKALKGLRQDFPATLADLVQLEGMGPKRTKQLYQELGIASVAELQKAIDSGKVEKLQGFGKKSAEKIRQSIQAVEQRPGRFKLMDADQLVRPLLEHLRQAPGIDQLEVAGSYRRRMETVGDVDILVTCDSPKPVMERFQSYPQVVRVVAAGTTRGTIILRSGLQVDLRILPDRSYGAALHYFTGSKAHNIAVRKLGVERGLRISEYGIFRVPEGKKAEESGKEEGKRIGGAKEEDVFQAVRMDWVPPELREDRGEVEAARKNQLPALVTIHDIKGDLQTHSQWTDGKNSIEEMVRACKERGYQYCAITDHSKAVRVAGGLDAKDFKKQWKEIEGVRQRIRGIRLLSGVEVDILPDGSLDLPDDILNQMDVVVASVHSKMDMTKAQMTKRVLKGLAHRRIHVLAHPTGRQINRREPFAIDLEEVFQAAKEQDTAVELNAQPERLDLNDTHVHRARELGVKITINTDAHSVDQLRFMEYGIDQARRGWLEKRDVLNSMTRAQLEKWLKQRGR